jgi:cell division protein FtsN
MTRDQDDSQDNAESSSSYGEDSTDMNDRREPGFGNFEGAEEDSYEEPDRDTDYTSGFRAESVDEEEEFEEEYEEDTPDEEEREFFIDDSLEDEIDSPVVSDLPPLENEEPPENYDQGEWLVEDVESGSSWPIGLISAGFVALILLAAGGYGVMQERAETQEELRQLRANLATIDRQEPMSGDQNAMRNMQQSYQELAAEADALTLENRQLTDTLASLEAQLGAQKAELTKAQTEPATETSVAALPKTDNLTTENQATPVSAEPAKPDPVLTVPAISRPAAPDSATLETAAPEPVASKPVASKPVASQSAPTAAVKSTWFVNFGSYTSKSTAESWSGKLQPIAGKVIVAPASKSGKTYYRVRVVGLTSQDSARKVAQQLEADQQVSKLWVGKE